MLPQIYREQLDYAIKVAEGLSYVHSQEILHNDIAARNVLVSTDGELKLADFGLATNAGSSSCNIRGKPHPISVRHAAVEVWVSYVLTYQTDIWYEKLM